MENEMIKIHLEEGVEKADVIIRQTDKVNEIPVKPPIRIEIEGILTSPVSFLEKRIADGEQIDQLRCHVYVNKSYSNSAKYGSIKLITNEHDEYRCGRITGYLILHSKFIEFGINDNVKWSPNELGQFFKMNRAYFPDKAENMRIVTELKSFVGKVNSVIEKSKTESGSFTDNYSGIVTSNLPKSVTLEIPLFVGGPREKIEVEFYANVDGKNISIQLLSPSAAEIMEEIRDKAIDTEIVSIQEIAPDIVIIETY